MLSHHLYRLENGQQIRRRRSGMHVRFYPMARQPPPHMTLDPTASRILQDAMRHAGTTQSALGRRLRMSRQLVHHHVKRMAGWRILEVHREGRASHLITPPGTADRMRRCPPCGVVHIWQSSVPEESTCPACQRPLPANPARASQQ